MSGADPQPDAASTGAASVTTVVVTYNSERTIDAALEPLRAMHDAGRLQCVVVDNASRDGTVALVRARHPWVRVVKLDPNVGFGRGCNAGWQRAATPYVLFLNPDASLPPAALDVLLAFMEAHPRAAIAGPAIEQPGGEPVSAGGLPRPRDVLLRAAGLRGAYPERRAVTAHAEPFRTDTLSGAVLLARRDFLEAHGGFDPRYFLYFEENDLCRRVLDRGFEVWAVGGSVAGHAAGSSTRQARAPMYTGCIAEHYFRSRYYYMVKHHGRITAVATEMAELVLLGLQALVRVLRGRAVDDIGVRFRSPILRMPAAPVETTATDAA